MKEIKFRAWDKVNRRWVEAGENLLGTLIYWKNNSIIATRNENFELIQYTGLLDKNGKEIYEGDIVEYGGTDRGWVSSLYSGKFEVRANLISGIELVGFFDQQYTKLDDFFNQFEVIGNIYENPELLNT